MGHGADGGRSFGRPKGRQGEDAKEQQDRQQEGKSLFHTQTSLPHFASVSKNILQHPRLLRQGGKSAAARGENKLSFRPCKMGSGVVI
jgi:hypothetical protein